MSVAAFVEEMEKLCSQFGIMIREDGDRLYMIGVDLTRSSAASTA